MSNCAVRVFAVQNQAEARQLYLARIHFRCSRTCTDLELVRPFPVCVNRAGRASRVVHILCDDDTGLRPSRAWHERAACTRAATRDPKYGRSASDKTG